MSDAVIIAISSSAFTTLGLIVVAYINTRQNKLISGKVDEYHKDVNGKMGQLLKVTGEAEKAKGVKQGSEENQAKTDAKNKKK